jgi:hypothetical protein
MDFVKAQYVSKEDNARGFYAYTFGYSPNK